MGPEKNVAKLAKFFYAAPPLPYVYLGIGEFSYETCVKAVGGFNLIFFFGASFARIRERRAGLLLPEDRALVW